MQCVTITIAVAVLLVASLNNCALATTPQEQQQQQEPEANAALVGSAPLNTLFDELPEGSQHQAAAALGENHRAKRATCDLLSGLRVGSSVCVAHCLAKRFRGGYCNSRKVCVCRK